MAGALDLDLADPAVARLIGGDRRAEVIMPGSTKKAAMVQIAGDEDHGVSTTTYLDRGKQEVGVLFRPKNSVTMLAGVLTVDVYAIPDEPLKLHLICPRCRRLLTVNGDRKPIDWNPTSPSPHPAALREALPPESKYLSDNLGVVSVGQFQCTWELEDKQQDSGKDDRVIASGSLCRFKGVIERNVLREV